MAFVVDTSANNKSPEILKNMLKFTKDMVSGLNVSARDVHVGLVAYGSNASVVFPFNDNANEVNKLIDSTTPRPGVPRLDLALLMASQLFSPAFGARKRVPKVDIFKTWS